MIYVKSKLLADFDHCLNDAHAALDPTKLLEISYMVKVDSFFAELLQQLVIPLRLVPQIALQCVRVVDVGLVDIDILVNEQASELIVKIRFAKLHIEH